MHSFKLTFTSLLLIAMGLLGGTRSAADDAEELSLLFLGDNGLHQPRERADLFLPVMKSRGIAIEYTDDVAAALTPSRLAEFDGLILYANIDNIESDQADALLRYVNDGGGFIPLHCASFCFRNNDDVVALIGAQFVRHGYGVFSVAPDDAVKSHPVVRGYGGLESWDESYVHTKHNEKNRTVLEYRIDEQGREPWTWIRTHGKGRVFYTAWGHDYRTWSKPGFQNLVERGIRWACGKDPSVVPDHQVSHRKPFMVPTMTTMPEDLEPFEYVEVGPKIPNYVVSEKWGQQESPRTLMQKPLSPAESIRHYVVPEGFHLDLFVAEPDIGGKPICMTWDEDGRLWVAESYDYPNEKQPEGSGRDRIRICEDSDGDGRADRFTVFADGLSIPTSMAASHGGMIVHQAPDTLFLKDTDGDDVADIRKVLFTGWKTFDTHAGPSNLQYGPDNWFYGQVGYAGFEGTIAGQKQSFRTGFYRFKVEEVDDEVAVTDFEFLRNTNNNTWGLGFSEEGLLFGSTANRNPSEFMPIANRHYERVRGWTSKVLAGIADNHYFKPITDKVRQVDHHGGYTAAAGHALYTARVYPQQYWNRTAFVAGPTGHLVGTFVLTPNGAGFQSTSPANLIASDDEWAAPIMAEVGPDGNVWVIDWYNYIVQHNPTPRGFETGKGNAYVSDLRDKRHGRVYRVVYPAGDNFGTDPRSLSGASVEQLVDALASTNMFWRRHAQRILVEQGDRAAVAALTQLARRRGRDSIGLNVGAMHALRTLDGLSALDSEVGRRLLADSLAHPAEGVVRTAIEVLPRNEFWVAALSRSGAFDSNNAQVRLAALLALAEMPSNPLAALQAIRAMGHPGNQHDRWMIDAATSVGATNAESFLVLALATPRTDVAVPVLEGATIISEHLARSRDGNAVRAVLGNLAGAPLELSGAILDGLALGWPKNLKLDLGDESETALRVVCDALPAAAKGKLIRLARSWGSQRLTADADRIARSLLGVVSDESASSSERIEAAGELVGLLGDDSTLLSGLFQAISPATPRDTAVGVVESLRQSDAEDLGRLILGKLDQLRPSTRDAAIRVLLARQNTTRDLIAAIENKQLFRGELTLDQQQALLDHPVAAIRKQAKAALSNSGGVPNPDRARVLESLMTVTQQTGDAGRGRDVFTKNCAACHMHRGEGKTLGPDLTGMAVHPKSELLTHIIDPSRSVEGNYGVYTVVTTDGVVITGMLASETQNAYELIDSQGKSRVVLGEDIEQYTASNKSVMPDGFEKQIDRQGLVDLLQFLTSRGRFLPLPIEKVATAISTRGLFHDGDDGLDRFVFTDWSPKSVGDVPFHLVDPRENRVRNLILLNGPQGTLPPTMPKSVRLRCRTAAKKIHLLSGVSGWGYPAHPSKSESMVVRLHYEDGKTEDHSLVNGVHFADYIRRVDVQGSEFALNVGGRQLRHIEIVPSSHQTIDEIEFRKGNDPTSPIIMAVTIEN